MNKYANKRIFFAIPAYNEGGSIGKVVSSLKKAGYSNIVVIDDGSRDNTYDEAKKQGAIALKHIINRGQGASLRTGIEYALMNGAEYLVTFDSDGQHRVEDLPAMLSPVLKGEADVALGSRFLSQTPMPLGRKILLKGSVWVQLLFYGVKLSDAHNGFRVMSRKAAQQIRIDSDRMEHASEILEEIVRKRIKYKEVPVTIRYTDYSMRKGHGSLKGAFRVFFKMVVKKLLH